MKPSCREAVISTCIFLSQFGIGCIPPHTFVADMFCFVSAGLWLSTASREWLDYYRERKRERARIDGLTISEIVNQSLAAMTPEQIARWMSKP